MSTCGCFESRKRSMGSVAERAKIQACIITHMYPSTMEPDERDGPVCDRITHHRVAYEKLT